MLKWVIPEISQPCVQRFEASEKAFEGNLVVVADDEVLPDVKGRQGIAEGGIDRIDLFAQIGRLVQRLAVGVSGRQFQPSAGMAQAELQERCNLISRSSPGWCRCRNWGPAGPRVPLITWPEAVVNTLLSPKGPQVGEPGATSLGWLRLRQSAGSPGFASTITRSRCDCVADVAGA